MLPLAKSGLVTISIFHFLWTWNDYIYAMTYVPSASKRTLSDGIVKLTSHGDVSNRLGRCCLPGLVL